MAMRRQIGLLKSQNQVKIAIREMNNYLTLYASDVGAWQELTQLYIQTERLFYHIGSNQFCNLPCE
jgi:hypothetical protein